MTDFDKDIRDDLERFFTAAKRESDDLSAGLTAQILQDAERVQEGFIIGLPDRPAAQGVFLGLRDLLGGWPAMAGLMTACTAGVWLGFTSPDGFIISSQLTENIDILDGTGLGADWNDYTESSIAE